MANFPNSKRVRSGQKFTASYREVPIRTRHPLCFQNRRILEDLCKAIETGQLKPGDKLQTEAELGMAYHASRITVARAVNELMHQGLVSRRVGSGTHVLPKVETPGTSSAWLCLTLAAPNL